MAHVLVSWLAYGHDFIRGENNVFVGVDETGLTVQFHRHFFAAGGHDEHIILYAEARQENLAERLLADLLRRHPGRVIRVELLPVRDIINPSCGVLARHEKSLFGKNRLGLKYSTPSTPATPCANRPLQCTAFSMICSP